MSDTERLRMLVLKIAGLFGNDEGTIKMMAQYNRAGLVRTLKKAFDQFVEDDFDHFTEDDMELMREHGYETDEEKAAAAEFAEIPFNAYVMRNCMKYTEPFSRERLVFDSMAQYKATTKIDIDENQAEAEVDKVLEILSNKYTKYLLSLGSDIYELNPIARLKGE
ncbi:MAG: hypothetical protein WC145_07945 [Aliarcobacter sp.]|jgi:hypothetical protein